MATYDKCKYDIPAYQEGNEADFEFELDENFPIDRVLDVTFQVKKPDGVSLLEKRFSAGTIEMTGRVVRIPFSPADTTGKVGSHLYEIDFINLEGNPFATIGGAFVVNRQVNTL